MKLDNISGTDMDAPQSRDTDARALIESKNIASSLDEDKLATIGMECKQGFEYDKQSREPWIREIEEWIDLAKQVREVKNFPWPDASNIKFPLMGIAAMQFSARAYPSLVPGDGKIVKTRVIGLDPDGQKAARGDRVAKFMSWQLLYDMENWEEDFDKMLMQLSVVGNMYKKTYFDPSKDKNVSVAIPVERLVVNYWAKSLEDAERISEIIYLYPREVAQRKLQEIFLDVDLGEPQRPEEWKAGSWDQLTVPYTFIEQHTYLDLDEDGYEEPYIVTFEQYTGKVVRIVARFDMDNTKKYKDGKKEVSIHAPLQYYTKFGFVPNPDGSFYDLGFGHLLGPINESVNTIVNQLTDAGTLSNMQGGFLGRGLRVKGGNYEFSPGEWKWVNATADDLRKQIVPLPVQAPSKVLFDLLQFLVTAGKELASVAEIFVGKMPGQNTPATTTMASIEQGMKVFTAIYKRVYRSLDKEFKKLYKLNGTYLDENTYVNVIDDTVGPNDFGTKDYDICPSADPAATSQTEKLAKVQGLMEMMPLGTLDPNAVTIRVLQAHEIPNWQELMPGMAQTGQPQPPPPNPKVMEMQMKSAAEEKKSQLKQQEVAQKMQIEGQSAQMKLAMEKQLGQQKLQHEAQKNQLQMQADIHKQNIFVRGEQMKAQVAAQSGQQDLAHKEVAHGQNIRHKEETQKLAQKSVGKNSTSGKKTQSRK